MDRRYFLNYSAITAAYLLAGCEERSGREEGKARQAVSDFPAAVPPQKAEEKLPEQIMPFTQKLKIPGEIDFAQIKKAALTAQKSQVNIFPDMQTEVLTFQGDLPNPTIRIKKGEVFDLDFMNNLADPTIIHWHGLIVPEEMDGHPKDAIATGATKQYRYPIEQSAGTFWYHTHPHGRTGEEIYRGLAGFYMIEDEEEKRLNLPQGEFELPLMIQDKRFDEKRQLRYKDPKVPQDNNGLLGDVILVNATPFPYHEVKSGKYRLRILNASSVRTYQLAFDTIREFALVGTDAGLLETPVMVQSVVLSVAERVDIIVDFKDKEVGDRVTLKTLGFKEGSNLTLHPDYPAFDAPMDIMQFHVTEKILDTQVLPEKLIPIPRLQASDAVNTRRITMEIIAGGIWTLDQKPFDMHRVDQRVKLGSTEIWEIKNSVHMAHPFHIHGVRFQVLDRDGKIAFPTDKGWKDTVIVMPFETVRIIVHFTMPGLFVYHCHILEHEDQAMMANLLVE
ncbi:multicopper oxidase family protein [Sulfurovum sp.]|jgi:FtsP/CotA-like multicopper oxidase with cupredoxin domain|uniref:multicopper oxidase family protein n=1 Tax=Sulfurovum sp. TaxID=1969726 RepID=UPI002A3588A6|nr:multicopper oxidase family protein [Sulfurovum sp.]MDY0401920.1 multicopper oxidase family protein [Sulfurovum sp.]